MVPFFDYLPEYDWLHDEIDDAVSRVVRSGRLVLGPEVEAFEAEFAAYCGLEHGVGVASGTDALALALRALEQQPQNQEPQSSPDGEEGDESEEQQQQEQGEGEQDEEEAGHR